MKTLLGVPDKFEACRFILISLELENRYSVYIIALLSCHMICPQLKLLEAYCSDIFETPLAQGIMKKTLSVSFYSL